MHFAVIAEAQQAEKVFRIGYLGSSGSDPPQAFRQGLRDLGYVEGKNIIFEYARHGVNLRGIPISPLISCGSELTLSSVKERGLSELPRMPAQQFPS